MQWDSLDIMQIQEVARRFVRVGREDIETHLAARNLFATLMISLQCRRPYRWTLYEALDIVRDPQRLVLAISGERVIPAGNTLAYGPTESDEKVLAYLRQQMDETKSMIERVLRHRKSK